MFEPTLAARLLSDDLRVNRGMRRVLRAEGRMRTDEWLTIAEMLADLQQVVREGAALDLVCLPEAGLVRGMPPELVLRSGLRLRAVPLIVDGEVGDEEQALSLPGPFHPWELLLGVGRAMAIVHDRVIEEAGVFAAWVDGAYAVEGGNVETASFVGPPALLAAHLTRLRRASRHFESLGGVKR